MKTKVSDLGELSNTEPLIQAGYSLGVRKDSVKVLVNCNLWNLPFRMAAIKKAGIVTHSFIHLLDSYREKAVYYL